MDPATAVLIGEGLKISLALYMAHQREQGKTEEEIKKDFDKILADVLAFDPNNIKDV